MKFSVYSILALIVFFVLENGCISTPIIEDPENLDPDTLIVDNPPAPPDSCFLDNLPGEYRFHSDDMTSTHTIHFALDSTGFTSTGILGYGFWFPQAPFSGSFEGCKIKVASYENVKRRFLNSPGGYERYYFESMRGSGEYFPEQDSFQFYIKYSQVGPVLVNFEGNIYFVKK